MQISGLGSLVNYAQGLTFDPAGTAKIRFNVNNMVYCPYNPDWNHVIIALDNFYLNYADQPATIFNLRADQITYRSARVRWLTDAYVGSHIDYGETTSYDLEANDPTPTTSRAITLSGLKPGRRYYYRATSGFAVQPQQGSESTVFFTLPALGDFDGDGDVDMEDFGKFQVCLTGTDQPQNDATCTWMKLDADSDVDADDMDIMLACVSGPGVALAPDCGE